MPRLVCYSSRGLARVQAQLRGALRTIQKFPQHPKKKRRRRKKLTKRKTTVRRGRPRKVRQTKKK